MDYIRSKHWCKNETFCRTKYFLNFILIMVNNINFVMYLIENIDDQHLPSPRRIKNSLFLLGVFILNVLPPGNRFDHILKNSMWPVPFSSSRNVLSNNVNPYLSRIFSQSRSRGRLPKNSLAGLLGLISIIWLAWTISCGLNSNIPLGIDHNLVML